MGFENQPNNDRASRANDASSQNLSAQLWQTNDMQLGQSHANGSTANDALPSLQLTGGAESFQPNLSTATNALDSATSSQSSDGSSSAQPLDAQSIQTIIQDLNQLIQELQGDLGQLGGGATGGGGGDTTPPTGGDTLPQVPPTPVGGDTAPQTGSTAPQSGGDTTPTAPPPSPEATSGQPTSGDGQLVQNPYGGSLAGWLSQQPGADAYQPASFDNPLPSNLATTGNAATDAAIVSTALNQATASSGTGFNAFGQAPDAQAQLDPAFQAMEAASNDPNFNQDLVNALYNSGMISNAEAALNAGQNIEASGGGSTNHLPLDGGQNDWADDLNQTVQNLEAQGIAPTIANVVPQATAAFNSQIESAFSGQGDIGEGIVSGSPGVTPWTPADGSSSPSSTPDSPAPSDSSGSGSTTEQPLVQNPYGGSLAGWLSGEPNANAYQPASFTNPLPNDTPTTGNADTDAAIVSTALNQATQASGTGFNAFGQTPSVQAQLDPAFSAMEKASNDPNFDQDVINAMYQSGMISNAEAALNAGQNIEGSGNGSTNHLPLDEGQPMYALDINQAVQDAEAQGLAPTIANVIPEATSLFNQQIMSSFSGDGW